MQTAIAQMKKIATNFLKSWQDSKAVKDKHKQLGLPQHELIQVREIHVRSCKHMSFVGFLCFMLYKCMYVRTYMDYVYD